MIFVDFVEVDTSSILEELASTASVAALENTRANLSVVFCTDPYIQTLNKQYRGIDLPTDVLSFPSDETDPESGVEYIGDIIISYPRAQTQAMEAGNKLSAEITMLVVHGVLHLRGFDHDEEKNKQVMWEKQKSILQSLDIQMPKFSGDE